MSRGNNSLALQFGERKAKELIARHILNKILVPMVKDLIDAATQGRIVLGSNMTGNTVNSYAGGVYVGGQLVYMQTSFGSIPPPLRGKLGKGQIFFPNTQRWDGEIQAHKFIAQAGSNGAVEAERSINFLQSHKPTSKGWAIVVCNGVEYATYQESTMNIDVLTNNFDYAKMFAPTHFKPMTE